MELKNVICSQTSLRQIIFQQNYSIVVVNYSVFTRQNIQTSKIGVEALNSNNDQIINLGRNSRVENNFRVADQ